MDTKSSINPEIKIIDIFDKLVHFLNFSKSIFKEGLPDESNLFFYKNLLKGYFSYNLKAPLKESQSRNAEILIQGIGSDANLSLKTLLELNYSQIFKEIIQNIQEAEYEKFCTDFIVTLDAYGSFHKYMESFTNDWSRFNDISRRFKFLKGVLASKFLKVIGYQAVSPERARIRILDRLGLVKIGECYGKNYKEFYSMCLKISKTTGMELNDIDDIIGAFSGLDKERKEKAICLADPKCWDCPIPSYCEYYKLYQPTKKEKGLTIKEWAEQDKPREKFQSKGGDSLSDGELLSIFIRTGTKNKTAFDLSRELISKFGDLRGLSQASINEIASIKGIGYSKAITIKAALEIGLRLANTKTFIGEKFKRSSDVFDYFRYRFRDTKQEHFITLLLDNKNKIMKEILISKGSLSSSVVHPREVFNPAIKESAASVIFVHNHPSGEPEPSKDDVDLTKRLIETGKVVGIKVLDHIIIGNDCYLSMADEELM